MNPDPYYLLPQCSNSDLSAVDKLFRPPSFEMDFEDALRFGTLVDALITEMEAVDVYKRKVHDYIYKPEEMELAYEMKKAFYRDPTCAAFAKLSEFQKISVGDIEFEWAGFKFKISCRSKWDGWMPALKHGYDIKTTTATTQSQFEDACDYFGYYRSRVFYSKLENTKKDMLIGISKVNNKVFKIPIIENDKYWKKGLEQANELAFNYWMCFDGFTPWVMAG